MSDDPRCIENGVETAIVDAQHSQYGQLPARPLIKYGVHTERISHPRPAPYRFRQILHGEGWPS